MSTPSEEDLSALRSAAKAASKLAYCPYSDFPVGAAVQTREGRIFSAPNIENASYGATICAERAALFSAVAKGHRSFSAVVLYTPTDSPVTPCGVCRQVMLEFGEDIAVVSMCDGQETIRFLSGELLPKAFRQ